MTFMTFNVSIGLTVYFLSYALSSTEYDVNERWKSLFTSSMSSHEMNKLAKMSKSMFDFAYEGYLKHAFPLDELDPINCKGRGHDYEKPHNINVNDALGGLLSAHLLITDPSQPFGFLKTFGYNNELLKFARDLGNRMMDNFKNSETGIPYPRYFLNSGTKDTTTTENCLAGAGTLILEFGVLSSLLNDPSYAHAAHDVLKNLWSKRSNVTGLFGSSIDAKTGEWINKMSGIGAGQDSFFEYLLKAHILFGDDYLGNLFGSALETLKLHLRTGRSNCLNETGSPPVYWNVNMFTGERVNNWVDSLQASWSSVLVLNGDVSEAICQHALHYFIREVYDLPPERYNLFTQQADILYYPLRPELAESTYFLYRATKHPFYLQVGKKIINSLDKYTKEKCGFATIHSVIDKTKEDRMESFFLSETLKYLYLLFDESNPLNRNEFNFVFSTQGHLFPVNYVRKLMRDMQSNPFESNNTTSHYGSKCERLKLWATEVPMDIHLWNQIGGYVHSKFLPPPTCRL